MRGQHNQRQWSIDFSTSLLNATQTVRLSCLLRPFQGQKPEKRKGGEDRSSQLKPGKDRPSALAIWQRDFRLAAREKENSARLSNVVVDFCQIQNEKGHK